MKAVRFPLGDVEIIAIQDSELTPLARDFFPSLDPGDESLLAREAERGGRLRFPVTVYVVRSDEGVTLVDAGVGPRPFVDAPPGVLLDVLEELGLASDRVDRVLFTHLHPDHIGGSVDAGGGPAFPNAVHTVVRGEWEFWSDPRWRAPEWSWVGDALDGSLRPIADGSAELALVESGTRLSRRLGLVPLQGHTPDHTGLAIEGTGSAALFIGDAMHHRLQCRHPHWTFRHDADPARAIETRSRLIRTAERDRAVLFGAHFSFPGVLEPAGRAGVDRA